MPVSRAFRTTEPKCCVSMPAVDFLCITSHHQQQPTASRINDTIPVWPSRQITRSELEPREVVAVLCFTLFLFSLYSHARLDRLTFRLHQLASLRRLFPPVAQDLSLNTTTTISLLFPCVTNKSFSRSTKLLEKKFLLVILNSLVPLHVDSIARYTTEVRSTTPTAFVVGGG